MELVIDAKGIHDIDSEQVKDKLSELKRMIEKKEQELHEEPCNSVIQEELEILEKALQSSEKYIEEKEQEVTLYMSNIL